MMDKDRAALLDAAIAGQETLQKALAGAEARAQKAENELRRFYKSLGQLTVEHVDLKSMLADAGVRVDVVQRRLDKLVTILGDRECCPPGRKSKCRYCDLLTCDECWKDWLEEEVQA